jgi:hypothetical protein
MAVALKTNGGSLEPGTPSVLFALDPVAAGVCSGYEVSADGQRFLVRSPLARSASSMTVVLNWTAALKK